MPRRRLGVALILAVGIAVTPRWPSTALSSNCLARITAIENRISSLEDSRHASKIENSALLSELDNEKVIPHPNRDKIKKLERQIAKTRESIRSEEREIQNRKRELHYWQDKCKEAR